MTSTVVGGNTVIPFGSPSNTLTLVGFAPAGGLQASDFIFFTPPPP